MMRTEAVKDAKSRIRKETLDVRDALSGADRAVLDRMIRERLFALPEWKAAESILIYLSFGSEADTWAIVDEALASGKKVYCPRITDRDKSEMVFVRLADRTDVEKNAMGICEPAGDEVFAHDGDALMILPGVAFSTSHERIGYGGGYYDRYLASHDVRHCLAVCYECQIGEFTDDEGPVTDILDVRPHIMITEKRLYRNDRH